MTDADYVLGRTRAEYERLIEQAVILDPLTERVLRASGIGSGMHVLDVGCGVGDVSFLLNHLVGPEGSVVGVDLDGCALEFADHRREKAAIANVSFVEGDVRTTAFEYPFDAAIGRFVLMFMSDPIEALRHIAGHVRPGGVLAFHEWTAEGGTVATSTQPALARVQRLIANTLQRSGAHLGIGYRLYGCMVDAGLEPDPRPLVEIAITPERESVGYRRWAIFVENLLPSIREYGLGDHESTELDLRHLKDELAATSGCVPLSWPMVGQWGRRI